MKIIGYGEGKGCQMSAAKHTGRALSMSAGLLTGVLSALVMTLAGAAVIAKLVDKQVLSQEHIGYAVMLLLIVVSWLGSYVSLQKIKRQKLKVCLLSGICFYAVLLAMTGLLFGGQYDGAGETALLILCGSLLVVLLKNQRNTGRKRRKLKTQNR